MNAVYYYRSGVGWTHVIGRSRIPRAPAALRCKPLGGGLEPARVFIPAGGLSGRRLAFNRSRLLLDRARVRSLQAAHKLKVQSYGGRYGAGCDIVRSTERRKEIVERIFIRYVHRR